MNNSPQTVIIGINPIGNRIIPFKDIMRESITDWFLSLGAKYGVNPFIFGGIYIGAIPFFLLSIAWLIRNYRNDKSIALPALSATFFFISAYLYLIIVGRNVPWWVYGIVVLMVIYGAYSTIKSVRKKMEKADAGNRE
ncbi:MAG: hypothetical protein ACR2J3_07360 [Aridibacter sp.]